MKDCIIYLRKSTESEDKQQLSIDAQKDFCLNYVKQNNFNVVEIIEESKSAKQP
jgi:DNA invertase Pin-like site-specific DNA recombinase